MAYKGRFIPKNKSKYMGDHNNIIYRSLWERKFMRYCDENPHILEWSSEEIVIPYVSPVDNRVHRYFPDFLIRYINKEGQKVARLIEVKPKKQTEPPKMKKTKRGKPTVGFLREAKTYAVNAAKWEAANEYCKDRGWEFTIITEENLFG